MAKGVGNYLGPSGDIPWPSTIIPQTWSFQIPNWGDGYFILIHADADNYISESNEDD